MHPPFSRPSGNVLLLGFVEQGNLGVGYLSASLREIGFRAKVLDIQAPNEEIVGVIKVEKPILVGFSLIFEYFLYPLANLVQVLRKENIRSHFTVGGHYPSLAPSEMLKEAPGIDSVVMFEGEQTLCELVAALHAGRDWREVAGLAYRQGVRTHRTPRRRVIENIDKLALPDRPGEPNRLLGRLFMPILASRGCPRRCTFCSIQSFYAAAGGKIVRKRAPERVVHEMEQLFHSRGVTVFLFQDDDFPLNGRSGRIWMEDFLGELRKRRLDRRLLWKISCRADDLTYWQLLEMKAHGLYLVYIGIESGNEEGLRTLNKGTTVEQNLEAAGMVKRAGLQFNYGFMLFDPSSSFASIRANLECLQKLTENGSTPVSFCKMLPYSGTPIMHRLKENGRLTTINGQPDYHFNDPQLDSLFSDVMRLAAPWLKSAPELSVTLGLLQHESVIIERSCPSLNDISDYRRRIDELVNDSNEHLLGIVQACLDAYENDGMIDSHPTDTSRYCRKAVQRALLLRDDYVLRSQSALLKGMACGQGTEEFGEICSRR